MIDVSSPASVSSRSEIGRMKSRMSAAMRRNARPISGSIPSSVAFLYSSSTTTDEMLLTRSRPFGPNGQLVDLAFRVLDSLVARVAQANGRNGDW